MQERVNKTASERADAPKIRDWTWWLERPAQIALVIYAAGFIVLSSHVSGVRYIATDLLDKNYFMAGGLFAAFVAGIHLMVSTLVDRIDREIADSGTWLRSQPTSTSNAYLSSQVTLMIVMFFAAVALISAFTTRGNGAAAITLIWALMAHQIHNRISSEGYKYWLSCAANAVAIGVFVYVEADPLFPIIALSAFVLWLLRRTRKAFEHDTLWHYRVDLALGYVVACFFFGKFIYPIIKHEYGGGEPRPVHVRYIDPTRKAADGYVHSVAYGPIIHANDSTLYVLVGNDILFFKRENIISVSRIATFWDKLRN